jgi:hypothetical protein
MKSTKKKDRPMPSPFRKGQQVYPFWFLNVIKAYDMWSAPIVFENQYLK